MSSLLIDVFKGDGLVSLNLAREDHRQDVLQALENGGFIILKNAITIDLSEQAKKNEVIFLPIPAFSYSTDCLYNMWLQFLP
jgi:hypothetical protein